MRIAAAQTAPSWGNPEKTAAIAVARIEEAASRGIDLLAFGETFLSGYPFWVGRTDGAQWDDADQKGAYSAYLDAAVSLEGPELGSVVAAVADTGVFTYLGVTERSPSRGTVYATYVAIDPAGGIVSAHRKLMPTFDERMVWGTGDGHGLRVHRVGDMVVGGLNCWENWIPAVRHAMYAQGIDLHVAGWPGAVGLTKDITRFIAMEGRCYVLSAGSLLTREAVPDSFGLKEAAFGKEDLIFDGGSAIAAPDGSWLVEPVSGADGLVVADIDPAVVRGERQNFDPAGHYFRGDVIKVEVDRTRLGPATFKD
ncbi:MAG: carbon-nitrogen hydrolase family protein [Acidimicrobiia bacterium]|nr:carbon-nitrogen hydrolase family protein [Acidimicrobiia bacterium]